MISTSGPVCKRRLMAVAIVFSSFRQGTMIEISGLETSSRVNVMMSPPNLGVFNNLASAEDRQEAAETRKESE